MTEGTFTKPTTMAEAFAAWRANPETVCGHCYGTGELATDEDESPWLEWAELPPPSNLAVVLGMVQRTDCRYCGGTGRKGGASRCVGTT